MGEGNPGKAVVGYATTALLAMCAAALLTNGVGETGCRSVVRATARTSLLLFTAAYIASSLRRLHRGRVTKWLLANRRYVGLSYAVSHTLHLAAIIALSRTAADFAVSATALVFGGLAYLLLYAMALTSSDRAIAAMGITRWRRLHRTGMHYNWFIFAQSYLPRALVEPWLYAPAAALILGGFALRVAAFLRVRSA